MTVSAKSKILFSTLGLLALAACQCDTTDESSVRGSGHGSGYSSKPMVRKAKKKVVRDISAFDRVFYAFDSYALTAEGKEDLNQQAAWLKGNPHAAILIAGNCDERGTREYNIGLGARRANAAREYLVAQGINPQRITVTSYGKDRPTVPGSTPEAWAQNRNAITTTR